MPRSGHGPLIVVSGPAHCGKSSLVKVFLRHVCAQGWRVAGIFAEGHWENNRRSGFTLVDLGDGRRTPLARRAEDGTATGLPYVFIPEGLAAGRRALTLPRCAGADLVVVDEVGALELGGRGWAERLAPLLTQVDAWHLWVVQSACLEAVCRHWHLSPVLVVDASRPDAADRMIAFIQQRHHDELPGGLGG